MPEAEGWAAASTKVEPYIADRWLWSRRKNRSQRGSRDFLNRLLGLVVLILLVLVLLGRL